MALNKKLFSDVIVPKKLKITDDYYSLKEEYISSIDGINFLSYKALKDVNDFKTNGFSHLFLTKKQKNSEILTSKKNFAEEYPDFVTTLSFFSNNANNEQNPGVWLAINKGYDTSQTNTAESSLILTEGTPKSLGNYLFRVECLDETRCRISHCFGDAAYYLVYDNGFKTSLFPTSEFTYYIDGERLKLYHVANEVINGISCKKNGSEYSLQLDYTFKNDEEYIIYINNQEEIITQLLNSSWITYNRNQAINLVDNDRTITELDTQFLIHSEYGEEDSANIIPLKNNLTYQGTVTNGDNISVSDNGRYLSEPTVNFRNYTTINSGFNQEYGNENITLTFNFTDQIYRLEDGEEIVFTIPEHNDEDIFGPLYPYEYLNVNESAFIRNGAFASNIPFFADKFRKFQDYNTSLNNCTYLCTWLYSPDEKSVPVWLDRYYYPDKILREDALTNKVFELSFVNNLDKFYNSANDKLTQYEKEQLEDFNSALLSNGLIDKISDVTLENGATYKYSRLSSEMVQEVNSNNADNRIEQVKDQNFNTVELSSKMILDGKSWKKINAESFAKTKAINFNTDIFLSPYKKLGIQLFGCDYKHGFNIQNRKDLSPFVYYATEESVYMLNNDFIICNQFNIFEKYGEKIKYLVVSGPFEDIYMFTEKSLLILDYDLSLKNKIKSLELLGETYYQQIYDQHIILHNKNLYCIVDNGKKILKIIFNEDTGADKNKKYRILNTAEFVFNFNMVENAALVQTEHIIKNLYFYNDILYAFNYDILKMSHDGDTIYGIIKENTNTGDKWYYIYNQSLSKLYTDISASKYAEFSSDISIDSIAYSDNGYFALVRGFDTSDENKTLEIYNRTKTKIYNYPLRGYSKLISLDYYRYIDAAHEEHDVFVALVALNDLVVAVEYQIEKEKIITHSTILSSKVINNFKNIIDSNYLVSNGNENKLYFNLFFNDKKPPLTYIWDLTETQEGWYNINVEIDTDKSIYRIKINDITVADFKEKDYPDFISKLHLNNSIFESSYYIGAIGKRYGTTLAQILNNNERFDQYSIINSKIKNTTIYNRLLDYYEYQAMRLRFSKINPLVITIPCGIRNGIEEIVRYFKFNTPGSISNNIKINISGLKDKIQSEEEKTLLKNLIIDSLQNNDYLTNIKEIDFI